MLILIISLTLKSNGTWKLPTSHLIWGYWFWSQHLAGLGGDFPSALTMSRVYPAPSAIYNWQERGAFVERKHTPPLSHSSCSLFKWAVLPQERVWGEQWRAAEPSSVCWGLAKRKVGPSGMIKEPSVRKEQAFMLVVKWLGSNKKNAGLDRTLFCLISSKSKRKKERTLRSHLKRDYNIHVNVFST